MADKGDADSAGSFYGREKAIPPTYFNRPSEPTDYGKWGRPTRVFAAGCPGPGPW